MPGQFTQDTVLNSRRWHLAGDWGTNGLNTVVIVVNGVVHGNMFSIDWLIEMVMA